MSEPRLSQRHPELPQCVKEAQRHLALSEKELKGLLGRLAYIDDIRQGVDEQKKELMQEESFRGAFDWLELHLGIALSFGDSSNDTYSWWRAHSQWSAEGNPSLIYSDLPRQFIEFIMLPVPQDSLLEVFVEWISCGSKAISALINYFFDSKEFAAALAGIISINATIAKMLHGVMLQRLCPRMSYLLA